MRAAGVFLRGDADQLRQLVDAVERGELRIDRRVGLDDLSAVHAEVDRARCATRPSSRPSPSEQPTMVPNRHS